MRLVVVLFLSTTLTALASDIDDLKNSDTKIRAAALDRLREKKSTDPAIADAVVARLNDSDNDIRWSALEFLTDNSPDKAALLKRITPLLDIVTAENRQPLHLVFEHLGTDARPALPKLCAFLGDLNYDGALYFEETRLFQTIVNGKQSPFENPFGDGGDEADKKAAWEAKLKILPDLASPDANIRLTATIRCAQYEGRWSTVPKAHRAAVYGAFTPLLNDPDLSVRRFATWALAQGRLLSPQAVEPAFANAAHTDPVVASLSLRALGQLHADPARVVPSIRTALKNPDPRFTAAAFAAASHLKSGMDELLPEMVPILLKAPPDLQVALVKSLGEVRAPGAFDALARLIATPDKSVREAVVKALDNRRDRPTTAIPILIAILKAPGDVQQFEARRALSIYGYHARAALPDLFECITTAKEDDGEIFVSLITDILTKRYRDGFADTPDDLAALTPPPLSEAAQRDAVQRIEPFLDSPHAQIVDNALMAIACYEKVELPPTWAKALPLAMNRPGMGMLSGLRSLAYAGPRATALIPFLQKTANDLPAPDLVRALRQIGPNRDDVVALLAQLLPRSPEAADALSLSPAGRLVLIRELYNKTDALRLTACTALGKAASLPPEAAEPLWLLTQSVDLKLAAAALTAIKKLNPVAPPSLDALRLLLNHQDLEVRTRAMEVCERLGPDAIPLRDTLFEIALSRRDDSSPAISALSVIGIDDAMAQKVAALPVSNDDLQTVPLLRNHPREALQFLKARPNLFSCETKWDFNEAMRVDAALSLFSGVGPDYDALRAHATTLPNLTWVMMAAIGDPTLLPRIDAEIATADAYHKLLLIACARACGRPDGRPAIRISATEPGTFKPASAWPNVDESRMDRGYNGHGDGCTPVVITGTLKRADGSAVKNPRFFGTNDRYLLGRSEKNPEPIKYNPTTGRFVFYTEVFAAYQEGPGPYQTGSAETLIESDNTEPLTVQFYDEMPDLEIQLSPKL